MFKNLIILNSIKYILELAEKLMDIFGLLIPKSIIIRRNAMIISCLAFSNYKMVLGWKIIHFIHFSLRITKK